MPNWKYPCLKCTKPVKKNQKGIECSTCVKWVHLKCTNLTEEQYNFLEINKNVPFCCRICEPQSQCADLTSANTNFTSILDSNISPGNTSFPTTSSPSPHNIGNISPNHCFVPSTSASDNDVILKKPNLDTDFFSCDTSLNDTTSSFNISSANSSDFCYVDESDSDSDSRGLNFKSLSALGGSNTLPNIKKNRPTQIVPLRSINYKYPCLVCLSPCKENIQDSICCTLCDEWVHHKCTDLTHDQFKLYCSPDHAGDPFYCVNCLYGNCSKQNFENQNCFNASEIEAFDINETIHNLCPNSIFREKEDIHLSEYYTRRSLMWKFKKLPIIS